MIEIDQVVLQKKISKFECIFPIWQFSGVVLYLLNIFESHWPSDAFMSYWSIKLNWSLSYRVLQICTPGTELYTRIYPYFGHCRNMYPASVRMYPAFSSIGIEITWHNFQLRLQQYGGKRKHYHCTLKWIEAVSEGGRGVW